MTKANASVETRFGGVRGNTPGKTSEQRQSEIINAQLSTEIQTRFLARLKLRMEDDGAVDAAIDAALDKLNLNAILKDAADRGFGPPKTSVDVTTNGKDVAAGIDLSTLSTETLAELMAARDAVKPD